MLKESYKRMVNGLVENGVFWNILKPLVMPIGYIYERRKLYEKKKRVLNLIPPEIYNLIDDKTVLHGPFKGMKYPQRPLKGMFCSLILGSYENEISEVIEQINNTNYSEIIDIGCAEGHYAVGFAYRNSNVKVYAYDINKDALKFCESMAKVNGVQDRIILGDFCSKQTLMSFNFTKKGLVMCDVEGYEWELFDKEVAEKLKDVDLLIEMHDFANINISGKITEIFSGTHHAKIIQSIDDIQKAKYYDYPELKGLSVKVKKSILGENRPTIMEWAFFQSKSKK